MNTNQPRRLSRVAYASLLIIALLTLALVSPRGRAFAQQILNFFTKTTETSFPVVPYDQPAMPTTTVAVNPVPAYASDDVNLCGMTLATTYSASLCQLANVEAQLGFPIKTFAPTSLTLTSLAVDSSAHSIQLGFSMSSGISLQIMQGVGEFPEPESPLDLVPANAVQESQVGGYPAEMVAGGFIQPVGSDQFVWDPTVGDIVSLRWKEEERWFEIIKTGHPEQNPMTEADVIALAENLVTLSSDTTTLSLNLDQRAGFDIRELSMVPDGFRLLAAGHNDYVDTEVYLLYRNGAGNDLSLIQVLSANAAPYTLAERFGENITITPVQVGSVNGSYVVRDDGFQAVVWEVDGIRIELFYGWDPYTDTGQRLDQQDMLRIAGSLK